MAGKTPHGARPNRETLGAAPLTRPPAAQAAGDLDAEKDGPSDVSG
jgi:hypothetical protein